MKQETYKPKTVSAYIAAQPAHIRPLLKKIRGTIRAAAPHAEETISYGMPAFKQKGMLVYFAGYAHHIGFYPGARAIKQFKRETSRYKTSKGTVQFSLDRPLPLGLITKIVKLRLKENLNKATAKTAVKK